jgi:ligand-binding sensor domain-containing protein
MTRHILNRLLVLALLAAALPAPAADEHRKLSQCIRENWTYHDGLPHNLAHRVAVARTGYLWIGTQEGLVRFDGVRFKVFAPLDTPGLAGNEVSALLEDERGVLWIGTSNGLSRMRAEVFEQVDLGTDAAVSAIASDGDGGVFVGTETDGVRHVLAGDPVRVERLSGLPDVRVNTLLRAGKTVWIGGNRGLSRLIGGRLEVLGRSGLPHENVEAIAETRDGTLWVGTSGGLARRRPGQASFERVACAGTASVYALQEDHAGALWMGTGGGPLLRITGEQAEAVRGTGSPTDIQTLAVDANGNVWAGSESGGLFRLGFGPAATIAKEEGLAADVVWSVREGRDGAVYMGGDGGLDRLVGDHLEHLHVSELHGASVAGLFEDRAGNLWVGTDVAGLFRFSAGEVTRFGTESGLGRSMARAIHEDARGTIWVGAVHGMYRMEKGRFSALTFDPALAGDTVNAIAERPDGSLWVGTTTGLARVEEARVVPVVINGQRIRSDVPALHAEPDGSIWIGTSGMGLARLSGGRLDRWTRREGLHEDTVLAILDDGAGHLWLSGNHGITRVSEVELEEVAAGTRGVVAPTVFGTADGMRERECNGGVEPSSYRGHDGRLWFATIRGAVVIDPSLVKPNPTPPPVHIEELVVDGHPQSPSGPLRFPPGTRRVDVRYTGLTLAEADRIRFRHRLAGLEEAFFDAGNERVAHYTNLGAGRYVFEVSAANASGVWSDKESLTFEVEPHLWQTRWFAVAVGTITLVLAVGSHLGRTRSLRKREGVLAARVEEEMRKVKILTGLLPTCAWCKKIRDEAGEWHQFESYVSTRADVQFSHGMCPECYAKTGGEER